MAAELIGGAPAEEPVLPKLTIEKRPDGSIVVMGPIADLMLCYGLLEQAKDALREHKYRVMQERQREALINRQVLQDINRKH